MRKILVVMLLASVALLITCHSIMETEQDDPDDAGGGSDAQDRHAGKVYDADFEGESASGLL